MANEEGERSFLAGFCLSPFPHVADCLLCCCRQVNSEVDAIIVAGMGDGSLRGYCTTWSTTKAIENNPGVAIHIDWMNDT